MFTYYHKFTAVIIWIRSRLMNSYTPHIGLDNSAPYVPLSSSGPQSDLGKDLMVMI